MSSRSPRQIRANGREALSLTTTLLQRARLQDPRAGVWEAADVQWSWRLPRSSDGVDTLFWVDDDGPVAGVWLTSDNPGWQCDPILVPGAFGLEPADVWHRALQHAGEHAGEGFEVPVGDHDPVFAALARQSGLIAGEGDGTAWMEASARPQVPGLPEGFVLVDRTQRRGTPHPMRHRNGDDVETRLGECSLYDPTLDLAVETDDGRPAGYSLYWFDPLTRVGLVEPVRVEAEFARRGLARAMVGTGIDRLARAGARRVKVSYESGAAAALYHGLGFRQASTTTWYRNAGTRQQGSLVTELR
ncbi:GNAT family N-acetyltransferase [Pseudactinotalea sp. Z1732]|uniref:GNAT family N-acetyltransferase n=1 Tax=Micrococcales TaxID=85006 RepID=UPI003C7B4549